MNKLIKIKKQYDDYKMGEILEVEGNLGQDLIKKGIAEEATINQFQKWEKYQFSLQLNKQQEKNKIEKRRNMRIKIDNYMDNAEVFHDDYPFFYDEVGIFWFWDDKLKKYVQKDEVDVMNLFDDILGFEGQTVNNKLKSHYMEAFKRVGRKHSPADAPVKWIQFMDKAYSISSNMIYKVTPDYFFTNPIPYKLGDTEETPTMDRLFIDWVGEDNIKLLYEIIAYCCYRAYPIQVLLSLVGNGRNGKSCFLRLLSKFIGIENTCSTELDLLVGSQSSRFESFKLYKKLVCLMGETNFGTLNKSSILKKLTGGDLIGFEMKGKKPFDDYNYAKMIIASNSLPTSDDTSDGFYRRWVIINFPNQFEEGKDILREIPEYEYNNLALKITKILPELIEKGKFHNQGNVEERKHKYILSSNPLSIFINNFCRIDENTYISYGELYTAYVRFLNINKKRRVKSKEFRIALEDEGYWIERTSKKDDDGNWKSGNWINGVELKEKYADYAIYALFPTQKSHIGDPSGKRTTNFTKCINNKKIEENLVEEVENEPIFNLNHKCFVEKCQNRETCFDSSGIPYCKDHWELMAAKWQNQ